MHPGRWVAGKYRLGQLIGTGAAAQVWSAEDVAGRRMVALKILAPELLGDGSAFERFLHEARALSLVLHPNVVAVYDSGVDELPYYTMELCDGDSLRGLLARERVLDIAPACDIAVQLLSALGAVHEASIVHRDVKPDNVLLSESTQPRRVKLCDFSTATLPGGVDRGVFGTPEYMSPEQALGNATDARTDLYSVGVVLYECLTGKRPFHSDEENSLADAVVNRGIVSVRALAPYVPEQLDAVVTRALAKDPDERPQSARELQRDLVVFTRYLRDSRSGEGDVVLPLVRRRDTIPPSLGGRPGTSRE